MAYGHLLHTGFSSCKKDFLDVVPVDRIPKEQFYKTVSDFNAAVYGIYTMHRNIYTDWELALYNLEETRSDNTNQNFGRQTEHKAVDNFTAQAGNTSIFGMWQTAYDCINLCNALIDRADKADIDETLKKQFVGEASFIRAHTYFLLVQDYGGVPLRLHETTSLSGDNNLARASVDSVYIQIENDLAAAAPNLPASYTGADVRPRNFLCRLCTAGQGPAAAWRRRFSSHIAAQGGVHRVSVFFASRLCRSVESEYKKFCRVDLRVAVSATFKRFAVLELSLRRLR